MKLKGTFPNYSRINYKFGSTVLKGRLNYCFNSLNREYCKMLLEEMIKEYATEKCRKSISEVWQLTKIFVF